MRSHPPVQPTQLRLTRGMHIVLYMPRYRYIFVYRYFLNCIAYIKISDAQEASTSIPVRLENERNSQPTDPKFETETSDVRESIRYEQSYREEEYCLLGCVKYSLVIFYQRFGGKYGLHL